MEDSKLAPALDVLERPSVWTPPSSPGSVAEAEPTLPAGLLGNTTDRRDQMRASTSQAT